VGLGGLVLEITAQGEVVWKYAYASFPMPPEPVPAVVGNIGMPLFRSERYTYDYPGLAEKGLKTETATK
jgi:hypothetical protein